MFLEIFGRFDFIPADSFNLYREVDESEEKFYLLTCSDLVLRGVKLEAHLLNLLYLVRYKRKNVSWGN
jgi:hypothetical protein